MDTPSSETALPSGKRGQSRLSAGLEKNLSSYALAAGSAGVALLACVQPSEAKVIATKTDVVIPLNGVVIQFDINGDGQPDFGLSAYHQGLSTCTFTQGRVKRPKARPPLGCGGFNDRLKVVPAQAANEVWQAGTSFGTNCAAALAPGALINRLRPFAPGVMAMYGDSGSSEGFQFCPWRNGNGKSFLGVKFLDVAGQVHYGWVRITVDWVNATIDGYAYETTPNVGIISGSTKVPGANASLVAPSDLLAPQVAEPASLGRLAQGASGLAAWRREDEVVAA